MSKFPPFHLVLPRGSSSFDISKLGRLHEVDKIDYVVKQPSLLRKSRMLSRCEPKIPFNNELSCFYDVSRRSRSS